MLRLASKGGRVHRIARCLYHRDERAGLPDLEAAQRALADHIAHVDVHAKVVRSGDTFRVGWGIEERPKVSIIIPTRNAAGILNTCVTGLLELTNYPTKEIVLVDNGSTDPDALDLYRRLEKIDNVRIVPFARPFNFSAACNVGALGASGALLLFLNNDIEVIHADWLDELVRWAQRPEVGIVGAKLLYPDRSIQHAGVVFGLGLVGHIFARARGGEIGLFGSPESYRNYLAVTGACQMMRREVFRQLGGFDERFRLSFSDVGTLPRGVESGLSRGLHTVCATRPS